MKNQGQLNCIISEKAKYNCLQIMLCLLYFSMGGKLLNTEAENRLGLGTDEYIRYILDKYSNTIIKLSYTYVKNICDAEDIAQDVLLALMKREKAFESEEYEKAWILRTTINKSKNYLKSGWVKRTVSLTEAREDINNSEELDAKEENQVMEAVLSLPEKYISVWMRLTCLGEANTLIFTAMRR